MAEMQRASGFGRWLLAWVGAVTVATIVSALVLAAGIVLETVLWPVSPAPGGKALSDMVAGALFIGMIGGIIIAPAAALLGLATARCFWRFFGRRGVQGWAVAGGLIGFAIGGVLTIGSPSEDTALMTAAGLAGGACGGALARRTLGGRHAASRRVDAGS